MTTTTDLPNPRKLPGCWISSRYPTLVGSIFDYGTGYRLGRFCAGVWSTRTGGSAKRYHWSDDLAAAEAWLTGQRMTREDGGA